MIVLKLGGSTITDKDRPETVDDAALDRAADAVAAVVDRDAGVAAGGTGPTAAAADGDAAETAPAAAGGPAAADGLVLVHGGGSFGHHHASEHGVDTTAGTHDATAARAIHGAMKALSDAVLDRLLARDVPALAVHPFSAAHRDADGDLHLSTGQIETMLAEGFVPVLHGDLVAHVGAGATVASGDELVVELADALAADRVGLCSTVPGVLDAEGAVVDRVSAYGDVADALGGSESTDVTGGMAAKVRALLALDAEASIFGLDALDAFLAGEDVGTTIE